LPPGFAGIAIIVRGIREDQRGVGDEGDGVTTWKGEESTPAESRWSRKRRKRQTPFSKKNKKSLSALPHPTPPHTSTFPCATLVTPDHIAHPKPLFFK